MPDFSDYTEEEMRQAEGEMAAKYEVDSPVQPNYRKASIEIMAELLRLREMLREGSILFESSRSPSRLVLQSEVDVWTIDRAAWLKKAQESL